MFCTSHSGASAGSFEDKIMLHCSAEMKRQQGITTEIGYYVFDILGYSGDAFNDDGLVVGKVQFQCNLNLSLNPASGDSTGSKRIEKGKVV